MSTPGELLEALGREARARFGNGGEPTTRVYRGRSVEELVPQIQRDLGADAIIVRRREGLTGGVLGFFQRTYVEIEAMSGAPGVDVYDGDESASPPAVAPEPALAPPPASASQAAFTAQPPFTAAPAPVTPPATPPPAFAPPFVPDATQPAASAHQPTFAPPTTQRQPTPAPAPTAATPPAAAPAPAMPQRPMLGYAPVQPGASPPPASLPPFYTRESAAQPSRAGSAYVTAHLAALARADPAKPPPSQPRRAEPAPAPWDPEPPLARAEREPIGAAAPAAFTPPAEQPSAPRWPVNERREVAPGSQGRARAGVARSLQRCGIGEQLAEELIDSASAHALALAPRAGLAQAVRTTLAQRIPVAPPLPSKGAVIVIVGAGGAGKTTCCATLLGAYRRSSSLSASFATITREPASSPDRPGTGKGERGELQMIISPHVMKPVPAQSPRALRSLRRVRGEGVAVLDTPSVSPSDRAGIRELASLLAELKPERVVVALPATLGATAAAQLLQALKPLGANALAVTHADETDQIGVAVEAACRFELAPEYILEHARAGGWRLRQLAPSALAERLLP
jgi:flagellar biosynthesis GTPase FlhF